MLQTMCIWSYQNYASSFSNFHEDFLIQQKEIHIIHLHCSAYICPDRNIKVSLTYQSQGIEDWRGNDTDLPQQPLVNAHNPFT